MKALECLVEKFDDKLNPIVVKELRQAVRARFATGVVVFFLLVQLLVISFYLLSQGHRGNAMGRDIFYFLLGVLNFTCFLLVPSNAGSRMSAEKSDEQADLLFITTLSSSRLILGKVWSTMMLALLVYSACLPFLTFTYLLRGIDLSSIFICIALSLAETLFAVQVAIFIGCIPGHKNFRALLGLMFLGALLGMWGATIGMSFGIVQEGFFRERLFWGITGTVALGIVFATGFFFVASTALISSPSCNRLLPLRIYILCAWLSSFVVAWLWYLETRSHEVVQVWGVVCVSTLAQGFMIAVSERDSIGMRLRARIPRRRLLRVVAFFFYSGAAGGMAFFATLALLSILALSQAHLLSSVYSYPSAREEMLRGSVGVVISMFAYCMTAVWIRRTFLASRVSHVYNWLIVYILCTSGSYGIYLVYGIFDLRQSDWILWIANPAAGFVPQDETAWIFLAVNSAWAVAMLALNFRWLLRQVRNFRPLEKES